MGPSPLRIVTEDEGAYGRLDELVESDCEGPEANEVANEGISAELGVDVSAVATTPTRDSGPMTLPRVKPNAFGLEPLVPQAGARALQKRVRACVCTVR